MDYISQDTFLTTLATGCPDGLHLVVVENAKYYGKKWNGQPLQGASYFSTGFSRTGRRRDEDIGAIRCIVLGDVGTKVDPAKILATPSWVMETSKGNQQWGYLLDWPTDVPTVEALVQACVEAGLTDKGERGASRLNRVPGSINIKEGRDNFASVVREWRPDLVYTLKTLAAALNVTPGKPVAKRVHKIDPDLLGVEDDIFDWLVTRNMVVRQKNDGWWEIVCPFAEEHSDGRIDASYKHLGSGGRAVSCHHTHGVGYTRRFFEWVEDQGGPKNTWAEPAFDAGTLAALAKITNVAYVVGKQPPRAQVAQESGVFTFGTLFDAIGIIPIDKLPLTDKGEKGYSKIQPVNYINVEAGLKHLGVQVRLNLLNGKTSYILPERIDMARFGVKTGDEIDGMIDAALCDIFQRVGLRDHKRLRDCFARIANSLYWHPVKDWIESVPWDGKDRFEHLAAAVTTPTPDLWRTYFRRWLLQTVEATCGWEVRRISPKALVLVISGRQGIGKTRFFESLMPGYVKTGVHLNLGGHSARDSIHQALQGAICELGELETTFKAAEIGALKAFISETTDEYRLPYASDWLKRPRCTSFCGTVNHAGFLNDSTGSRRYLVVEASKCVAEHATDMQQLWAQAHAEWKAGEQWWLTPDEEAQQIKSNDDFTSEDPVDSEIESQYLMRRASPRYGVKVWLTAGGVLKVCGVSRIGRAEVNTAADTLRRLIGKSSNRRNHGGGPKVWPWQVSPEEVHLYSLFVEKATSA